VIPKLTPDVLSRMEEAVKGVTDLHPGWGAI